MTKRMWKIAGILILISAGVLFINRQAGLGLLVGEGAAVLLYKRNEWFWSGILDQKHSEKWTGFTHFLLNYAVMAGVLVLAAFFPQYLNIFACAVGLFLIKITATADVLIK